MSNFLIFWWDHFFKSFQMKNRNSNILMKISHFLISLMKTRKIEVFDWWADQSLFSLSSVIIIFLFYWLLFIIKSEFFFQSFFFRASIYLCWQHQFFFFFKNVLLHHSIYNGIVDKSTISMYVKNNNDMIKLYLKSRSRYEYKYLSE